MCLLFYLLWIGLVHDSTDAKMLHKNWEPSLLCLEISCACRCAFPAVSRKRQHCFGANLHFPSRFRKLLLLWDVTQLAYILFLITCHFKWECVLRFCNIATVPELGLEFNVTANCSWTWNGITEVDIDGFLSSPCDECFAVYTIEQSKVWTLCA